MILRLSKKQRTLLLVSVLGAVYSYLAVVEAADAPIRCRATKQCFKRRAAEYPDNYDIYGKLDSSLVALTESQTVMARNSLCRIAPKCYEPSSSEIQKDLLRGILLGDVVLVKKALGRDRWCADCGLEYFETIYTGRNKVEIEQPLIVYARFLPPVVIATHMEAVKPSTTRKMITDLVGRATSFRPSTAEIESWGIRYAKRAPLPGCRPVLFKEAKKQLYYYRIEHE